ncbi:MAG: tetratricopeptide repeat protein [Gemmatimonadaceae bacterium]
MNRPHGRAIARGLVIGALLVPAAACSGLLEVDEEEFIPPEVVNDPKALPNLVAGAISDFRVAYSGGGLDDEFLSNTANFTDEFRSSDTFPTRTATDMREQLPAQLGNTIDSAYFRHHRARRALNHAADAVEQVAGAGDVRIAELRALQGYTHIALAEGFCSGIRFSATDPSGQDRTDGPPVPTLAVFDAAVALFDEALGIDPDFHLAKIGKGRALLARGEFAAAAAAVAGVPTGFVYLIEHSDNSDAQQNPMFNLNISNERYTLSEREGTNGLNFRSANDPRVPWRDDLGGGFLASVPLFENRLYNDFSVGVPLADGLEARLIEAEALLNAGNAAGWLPALNALRANLITIMEARFADYEEKLEESDVTATSLAPLADPGTLTARVDLMFRERAFWLFNTGRRLGDLRRLVRITAPGYARTPDSIFPAGTYHKGGTYGNDVAWPIPANEENNPNFSPSGCNVEQA